MVGDKANSLNNTILSIRIDTIVLVTLVKVIVEENFGIEMALEVVDIVMLVVDLGALVVILVAKAKVENDNPGILINHSANYVVELAMLKCSVLTALISRFRVHVVTTRSQPCRYCLLWTQKGPHSFKTRLLGYEKSILI